MGESKHTPRPWHPNPKNAEREEKSVLDQTGGIVALVATNEHARLIAAAPDLLEALQLVRGSLLFDREDSVNKEVLRRIDVAIAKAEGRT